jgi:hypothetical protein
LNLLLRKGGCKQIFSYNRDLIGWFFINSGAKMDVQILNSKALYLGRI